jgi:hypothetical protein
MHTTPLTSPSEAPPEKKKESPLVKGLKLLLKILITLICFWYISTKVSWKDAAQALQTAHVGYLILAVVLYLISKIISSFRLNIYFRNAGLQLSQLINGKLYWMGMFYNLFLPGAISGDAYKVILLNRRYGASYKKMSAAVLLDRFSGLLALGVLLALYGLVVLNNPLLDALAIGGAIAAIAGLYLIIRFFFYDFLPGFWATFFWGLAVQAVQVVCLYALLMAIGQPLLPEWIFISLVATVVAVLPLSLGGGLGTRELVFAEGATYFGLDPALAVVISLLFYFCNLVTSVWGVYFTFRDPLSE